MIRQPRSAYYRVASCLVITLVSIFAGAKSLNAAQPKLVVLVTIDQLPYSYVMRFSQNLDPKGIAQRIQREGASFSHCDYRHACTYTGPGHATLSTGAHPSVHGVIDNSWYDRETAKVINCVADGSVETIGSANTAGASPKNLLVPTLGDALKLATDGKAKVFSIGVKDRAVILTAGRLVDGAFWMDPKSGNWITSTIYSDIIPGYLRQRNEANAAQQFAEESWDLLHPLAKYNSHRPDNDPTETPSYGMSKEFPHVLPAADADNYVSQLKSSPFCNRYLLATATDIVQSEQLGADEITDLLCVNFSPNDYVGHSFGPYSLEVEDMFYRTELQLGLFADELDRIVGKGEWTMAISSDHGVAPNPVYAERLGLLAKANPLKDLRKVKAVLEAQLSARFGELSGADPTYVESVRSSQIYLRETHPNLQSEKFSEAQRLVRTLILAHPSVIAAMTRDELLADRGQGAVKQRMVNAFHPDRSGDIAFVMAPYQYDAGSLTASHGSPWRYDTHVPMMLLGNGVKNVASSRQVDPSMLAPTLAKIMNIPPPAAANSDILHDALAE